MLRQKCLFGLVSTILLVIVAFPAITARAQGQRVIHVSSVPELYAAINDPDNAGSRIVLAPGTYFLDPTQPNGGRLEFQQDMDVVGQRGDADAVVIDASNLPPESFQGEFGNTGAVRMGRGHNALEWLTIQNAIAPAANAGAVETDLLGLGPTVVRVAHIVAQGNRAGISFRNVTGMDGRVLHGIAEDTVLRENTAGAGYGIRAVNAVGGVAGAMVWVTLRGNHSSGNLFGLYAGSLSGSSHDTILIESRADRFTNNVVGCSLGAGNSVGAVTDSNMLVFEADGDVIADNDGTPTGIIPFPGGIAAFGGASFVDQPNRTSGNVLQLALVGTRFSGNHPDSDVTAFGARGTGGVLPGTDNHVNILLKGVSRHAAFSIVDSDPPDPDGTNTVVVRKAF